MAGEELEYDPRLNDLATRIRIPIGMILGELPEDLPERVWYRFSFDVCVLPSGVQVVHVVLKKIPE